MNSPFPKSFSAAGEGRIVATLLPTGASGLEVMTYQYPLKLISPLPSSEAPSVLVFLLSYGGGLVGGDRVSLRVDVRPGARLSIVTQGHTKVFNSPAPGGVVTRQALDVDVGPAAAMCLLPDPVQPFAESVYEQRQVFHLAPDASLCLLDWVTQGRLARGEDWSLGRWVGRNEVWLATGGGTADGAAAGAEEGSGGDGMGPRNRSGRLLVRDAIILDGDHGPQQAPGLGDTSLRETMHGNGLFGTLILRGPLMRKLGDFFLSEFAALPRLGARDFDAPRPAASGAAEPAAPGRKVEDYSLSPAKTLEQWRAERLRAESEGGVLWSAGAVRGCVVVKFGATSVEAGRLWIGSMLVREGSTAENFGDQALMFVR